MSSSRKRARRQARGVVLRRIRAIRRDLLAFGRQWRAPIYPHDDQADALAYGIRSILVHHMPPPLPIRMYLIRGTVLV